MTTAKLVRCAFCSTQATMEHATEAGWIPYYYADGTQASTNPVCHDCTEARLVQGDDMEWVLKPAPFDPIALRKVQPEWFVGIGADGTHVGETTVFAVVRMRDGTVSVTTAIVDDIGGEPIVATTRMHNAVFACLRLARIVPNMLRAELFDAINESI